jgi:hypothetical protein
VLVCVDQKSVNTGVVCFGLSENGGPNIVLGFWRTVGQIIAGSNNPERERELKLGWPNSSEWGHIVFWGCEITSTYILYYSLSLFQSFSTFIYVPAWAKVIKEKRKEKQRSFFISVQNLTS